MNLRFEVSLCAHLLIHFLNLLVLLVLQVFHGLLVDIVTSVVAELVAPAQCCPCIISLHIHLMLTYSTIYRLLLVGIVIRWRHSLLLVIVVGIVVVLNWLLAVH